ncbi:MAG: UDP-N-acetylmuramate dehydrogenase [Clostridia bacterium]|nr:UDP-N-acetylmuramate dehydrogenase [Clostridia bacterium]
MDFNCKENINMAPFCSMKVGGNAKYFARPTNEKGLVGAIVYFREKGEKFIVVGNCSNLIFADSGYDGAVISTAEMKGLSFKNGVINALCGDTLSSLARCALENSLTGLEFCYGIPGTVGGAVFMNAGAYGGEISEHFVSGRFLNKDNEVVTLYRDELEFGYRKSRLHREELILISAEFTADVGNKDEIRAKMDELMQKRKSKQPLEFPSCGSAFKRPEGYFAGALIEQCGLKGCSIGGARVSEKHAGFIINGGNATATDVIELLKYVADTVKNNTGVTLEPEIRVIL